MTEIAKNSGWNSCRLPARERKDGQINQDLAQKVLQMMNA
jgi:hypothetical protein